jgi:proteasome lid subunit RPN8/RPN11
MGLPDVTPPFQVPDPGVIAAIRAHALAEHPRECCGVITADGYRPLRNIAPAPEAQFECTEELAPYLADGTAVALLHSHTNGIARPSHRDIAQQIAMNIVWGLVMTDGTHVLEPWFWGDGIVKPPLVGRQFRFGPSGTDNRGDCAAVVRDYYRQELGIELIEHPRPDDYDARRDAPIAAAYYPDVLKKAGFRQISAPLQIGDVALMRACARIPNHVAVLVAEDEILHHYIDRLSRREPLVRWAKCIAGWYRHASRI